MKRILFIQSSLLGADSASTRIALSLIERLVDENPGSAVTRIDLAEHQLPHLDLNEFNSWLIAADQRDESQQVLASRSDTLIEQLLSHDTLVLAVPMYNLGIPSTLKAWIDRVSRAGKTFRYTAAGPLGMIENMQAYVIFARGGIYRDTPLDTQTGYLTAVLGMMGIGNVETIFAEGLNMGEEARNNSMIRAMDEVNNIFAGTPRELSYVAA